jgi:hypothetical protein
MGGMPSFAILRLGAMVPGFLSRPVFRRKIRAMVMSSMTQDILLRGSGSSEIDSLTGYVVGLAREYHVDAPFNETIYRLAREGFAQGFKPMSCEAVMAEIEARKKS